MLIYDWFEGQAKLPSCMNAAACTELYIPKTSSWSLFTQSSQGKLATSPRWTEWAAIMLSGVVFWTGDASGRHAVNTFEDCCFF